MEAISDSNLSKSQLEQVNACRMFLQVTTLAEVVDHTGMLILPQVLKLPCCDNPKGLTQLSSSKLEWPHISPPSAASWLWNSNHMQSFHWHTQWHETSKPLGSMDTSIPGCTRMEMATLNPWKPPALTATQR